MQEQIVSKNMEGGGKNINDLSTPAPNSCAYAWIDLLSI